MTAPHRDDADAQGQPEPVDGRMIVRIVGELAVPTALVDRTSLGTPGASRHNHEREALHAAAAQLTVVPPGADVVRERAERRTPERQLRPVRVLRVSNSHVSDRPSHLNAVPTRGIAIRALAPAKRRRIVCAHAPSMCFRITPSVSTAGRAVALITLKDTTTLCTSCASVSICPWPHAPSTYAMSGAAGKLSN